uniref:Uncharacterized protein n=1 Tax=Anguilla anguilla TaxID=7936 RepID=A0A0E9VSA1_ANGAN
MPNFYRLQFTEMSDHLLISESQTGLPGPRLC